MGILDGEGWGSFRGVRLRKTETRSALAMSLNPFPFRSRDY